MTEETDRPSESVEEEIAAELEAIEPAAVVAVATDDEDEDDKPGGRRYAPEKWLEIETHWECGTMTAVEISAKYGVHTSTLTKHFARHKIFRNSKKAILKAKAEVEIMGAVAAAADPLAVAYESKRKGRITQTRETYMNQTAALTARWMKIEKEIIDGTRTEGETANDFKAMRHAVLAAKVIAESRLAILNADADVDEAKLPTLIFRDLTEEEINQRASADDDDDLGLAMPLIPEDEDEVVEEGVPSLS